MLKSEQFGWAEEIVEDAVRRIRRSSPEQTETIAGVEGKAGDFYGFSDDSYREKVGKTKVLESALKHYEEQYRILQTMYAETAIEMRMVFTDMIRCLYFLERYVPAMELCTKVIEIDKAHPDNKGIFLEGPWKFLGYCYTELKQFLKAEESFQKALELNEKYGEPSDVIYILKQIAALYEKSGDNDKENTCLARIATLEKLLHARGNSDS